MSILFILIPASILLGLFFVVSFKWALSNDQFDDLETPAIRILDSYENSMSVPPKKEKDLETDDPV